ncbi:MAG: STAS/SEC14 domain-containing protein [Pseudoruegeria sp.]
MIELLNDTVGGVLHVKATGQITGDDYENVLLPALEAALIDYDTVRLLMQIGPGFEGYTAEAAIDDAKLGLKHWNGFERIALVSDVGWIHAMLRGIGFMFPCPTKSFDLNQEQDARLWLGESLGAIHMQDLGHNVLHIELLGELERAAYGTANEDLDVLMVGKEAVKLLLDMRQFEGWMGIGAMAGHFGLVRDHYKIPSKVALVGTKRWQKMAEKIASHFLRAEVEYFDAAQFDAAKVWLND